MKSVMSHKKLCYFDPGKEEAVQEIVRSEQRLSILRPVPW